MTAPAGHDLDLQRAIVTKLKADSTLKDLIGDPIRLFQDVPPPATLAFPYVTIGPTQTLPDLAECIEGADVYSDLHVFVRSPGYELAKRIGAAIIAAIHHATLTLQEHRCLDIAWEDERYFTEVDNTTKHGVITFKALIEPTD